MVEELEREVKQLIAKAEEADSVTVHSLGAQRSEKLIEIN